MNSFQRFVIRLATIFYPVKVIGAENLPSDGSMIVCNHLSSIDVVYIAKIFLHKQVNFVAKKELFENKFSNKILTSYGGIPIDRDNPKISSIIKIIKTIKSGKNMVIFPEGTRNKSGNTKLLPLKGGSGIFAIKAKSAIVPMIVYKRAKLFCKNFVCIGKPFYLDEFYNTEMTEEKIALTEQIISNKMKQVQDDLFFYIASKKLNKDKNK